LLDHPLLLVVGSRRLDRILQLGELTEGCLVQHAVVFAIDVDLKFNFFRCEQEKGKINVLVRMLARMLARILLDGV
jgi:hypothetical protein